MRRVLFPVLSATVIALSACGGSGDEPAPPTPGATATAPAPATTRSPEATRTAIATGTAEVTASASNTPTPATEATTPITQHTNPTPAGSAPPPPPTATPTPPPAAGNPASATVGVSGVGRFFWSPGKVAIAPGGSVTWAWGGNDFHDVVVEALGYSSGNPVKAGSYALAFPGGGTYTVVCSVHPDTMRGTVTVE